MKKTWMPTTSGVLNIISGILSLLGALCVFIATVFIGLVGRAPFVPATSLDFDAVGLGFNFVIFILAIIVFFLVATGVVSLIGGICALQRKKWGLALAGSIVAILGASVLGVASTVLTIISKEEFK
jgi:hypothetical protein